MTFGFPFFAAQRIVPRVVPPATSTEPAALDVDIGALLKQFTGDANILSSATVAIDATLLQFTASANITVATGVAISAALKQFTASANLIEDDDVSISASLYQFIADASVTNGSSTPANAIQIDSEDVVIDSEYVEIAA